MSLLHRALVAAVRGAGGRQQVGGAGCHVSPMRSHTCLVTSVTRVPGPGPVHLVPGLLAPRARRAAAQPRLAPRRRHPRQHEVLPLRPPDRPLPQRQGCGVRHCQLPADDQGNQQNNKRDKVNANVLLPQPEWLWEMNPVFGKVPVLLHDGHTIYESLVTCEYIEVSVMVEC